MNLSVVSRQALKTLVSESIDEQLHVLGKVIRDFEKIPDESSHRLCQDLRAHLGRIRFASESKPDQVRAALDLLKRVKTFDPRRAKIEEDREREEEAANPGRHEYDPEDRLQQAIAKSRLESSKPVLDGYEPSFVNAVEAVGRITGLQKSQWSDTDHTEVLQTALGDLVLDDHSVRQLWLAIANGFHDGLFPNKEHEALLSHLVAFANQSKISLPTPNCFVGSIREELEFRS